MAPLPKRKHSTRRKGLRMMKRNRVVPQLVVCSNCGKKKIAHRTCRYCKV